jgi:hypothetical protein
VLCVLVWSSLLFAEAEGSFYVEASAGMELSPEQLIGDNYTAATGFFGEASVGKKWNRLSLFINTKRESYDQSSRNAQVKIDYWTYGAGAQWSVWTDSDSNRHQDVFAHAQIGSADYKLSEDDRGVVKKGSENIILLTVGSRLYYPMSSRFEYFVGAQLSYSSLEYAYPQGYSGDESSPTRLNFCGLGGFRYLFP